MPKMGPILGTGPLHVRCPRSSSLEGRGEGTQCTLLRNTQPRTGRYHMTQNFCSSFSSVGKLIHPGPLPTLSSCFTPVGWQEGDKTGRDTRHHGEMLVLKHEGRHRGSPSWKTQPYGQRSKATSPGPGQPVPPLPAWAQPSSRGTDQV